MTSPWAQATAVVTLVAAFGTAVTCQVVRDRRYPRHEALERSVLYVTSPAVLRRMVLSFDALAADVYWIRALQHYGGDRLAADKARRYQLLYPLLDLTTSLDPYFTIAYRFGAIFLSEPYPGGAGRPDQAIALLRKGIAAEPSRWQYYHDIAFVHYWRLGDMQAAARWFRMAAEQPGSPDWLEPVAASMLIQGGDRASARFLLQELLRSEEAWLQRMATRSLLQLDALDAIDRLQPVVSKSPDRPYTWLSLVQRGVLPGVPVDPTGVAFDLDAQTGVITVSRDSELFPMPTRRTLP